MNNGQQEGSGGARDWGRALLVMEQDLEHSLDRRRKIQTNFEERVHELQAEIKNASMAEAAPPPTAEMERSHDHAMRTRLEEAMTRRDDLMRQWREAREASQLMQSAHDSVHWTQRSSDPEVQRLLAISQHNKAELEALKQEMALKIEWSQGSTRQQALQGNISQLYDELDGLQRNRDEERQIGESEINDLKNQRSSAKDNLADLNAKVLELREKGDDLRNMEYGVDSARGQGAMEPLRDEHAMLVAELGKLRQLEVARKQAIGDLEREQEALVEKTSMIIGSQAMMTSREDAAQNSSVEHLEADVEDLHLAIDAKRRECENKGEGVARLKMEAQAAAARSESLREMCESLQQQLSPQKAILTESI